MENKNELILGLMRPDDAAMFLSCSRSQVYRLLKSGDLPHVKVKETTRIYANDIIKYCEKNTHERLV